MLFLTGLFLLVRVFGELTPPFQSPDEFNHLKRAYLLSRGVIAVGSRGTLTGAEIDDGLLAYMECFDKFPFDYGVKFDRSTARACAEIRYTGTRRFSSLANTAMYFPLLYMPQALALLVGEKVGLSVNTSYYMARLFSSCATLALLMWALMIYPVPPAALALFLMPTFLFQVSSASLDAMSFATSVLSASLFLRASHRDSCFSPSLHVVFALSLFLLATSRIIYVALSPLLLFVYRVRRTPVYAISFIVVLGLSLAWIMFALATVHGGGAISQEMSSSDVIRYYLVHPGAFLSVVFRTLTDAPTLRECWRMFIAQLGWGEIAIGSAVCLIFTAEFVAIVIASSSLASLRCLTKSHLALACAGGAAMLLLLVVALSAWTVHPATIINGLQGRYFYPIAFLLVFACRAGKPSRVGAKLSFAILIVMAASSVEFVVPNMLARYYSH
jgi:uncharacterized membrane protein